MIISRRTTMLGALSLAACGQGKAPAAELPPLAEPVDMALMRHPAFALAMIADTKRFWPGMTVGLVVLDDEASLARAFNEGSTEVGGLAVERFLFWRSGGTRLQLLGLAAGAANARTGCYVIREGMEHQDDVALRTAIGLERAEEWLKANAAEAASLVSAQVGAPVTPEDLAALVTAADNRALFSGAEPPVLAELRPIDERLRDENLAGHRAFLPELVASGAGPAWEKINAIRDLKQPKP